jgi:hypothetical protein
MPLPHDKITPAEIDRYEARAVELLKEAARIFRTPSPSASQLLDAGRSIAWAIRRANDLGFRHSIEAALNETQAAARAAALRNSTPPSWRKAIRQSLPH